MDATSKYLTGSVICILVFTIAFICLLFNGEVITYDCIYYNCTQYAANDDDVNNNCNSTLNNNTIVHV